MQNCCQWCLHVFKNVWLPCQRVVLDVVPVVLATLSSEASAVAESICLLRAAPSKPPGYAFNVCVWTLCATALLEGTQHRNVSLCPGPVVICCPGVDQLLARQLPWLCRHCRLPISTKQPAVRQQVANCEWLSIALIVLSLNVFVTTQLPGNSVHCRRPLLAFVVVLGPAAFEGVGCKVERL